MRNNPLNDLIHGEQEMGSYTKYLSSQEGVPEEDLEKSEENESGSREWEDMNDNIFLFLD